MFYILFYILSLYAVCHCHEWAPLELGWHPGPDAAPVGPAALPHAPPGLGAVGHQVLVHFDAMIWALEGMQVVPRGKLGRAPPVPLNWVRPRGASDAQFNSGALGGVNVAPWVEGSQLGHELGAGGLCLSGTCINADLEHDSALICS